MFFQKLYSLLTFLQCLFCFCYTDLYNNKWAKKNAGRDLAAERKARGEDEEAEANVLSLTGFVAIPDKKFYCPLTKEIMEDPVVTKEGIRFERSAIMNWFEDKGDVNPIKPNEKLYPSDLITDTKLQWEIRQWNLQHGDASHEMTRLELETKLNKASMVSRDFHISDILRALTENVEVGGGDMKPGATSDETAKKAPPAMPDRANVLDVLDEVVGTLED